jgi:hypothetical protein
MKTIALLVLLVNVNASAMVSTWDFLYYTENDPWETVEEAYEETSVVITNTSFEA